MVRLQKERIKEEETYQHLARKTDKEQEHASSLRYLGILISRLILYPQLMSYLFCLLFHDLWPHEVREEVKYPERYVVKDFKKNKRIAGHLTRG